MEDGLGPVTLERVVEGYMLNPSEGLPGFVDDAVAVYDVVEPEDIVVSTRDKP